MFNDAELMFSTVELVFNDFELVFSTVEYRMHTGSGTFKLGDKPSFIL